MNEPSSSITTSVTTAGYHQPSNTKLKYDRIKLRSRQKHKQPTPTSSTGGAARSLSNSSQALKSDDFIVVDDFDDDDMMYENGNGIKNAKSLGYLTASSVSNGGGSGTGTSLLTCDEDRMRRSLSNYTYLNGSSGTGSSYFYRENGSRHSLKPLSTSNGSLNNNWYKPKSLQLPPASNLSSSNLESALNGPPTTTYLNNNNNKTGIL